MRDPYVFTFIVFAMIFIATSAIRLIYTKRNQSTEQHPDYLSKSQFIIYAFLATLILIPSAVFEAPVKWPSIATILLVLFIFGRSHWASRSIEQRKLGNKIETNQDTSPTRSTR